MSHKCNTENLSRMIYTPARDKGLELAYKCLDCGSKWFRTKGRTRLNDKWRLVFRNRAGLQ